MHAVRDYLVERVTTGVNKIFIIDIKLLPFIINNINIEDATR